MKYLTFAERRRN